MASYLPEIYHLKQPLLCLFILSGNNYVLVTRNKIVKRKIRHSNHELACTTFQKCNGFFVIVSLCCV